MTHETYAHDVEVQYRDLDPRSHVNHAHYVSYMEQAKAAFFRDVLGTPLSEPNTAVRHLTVDFEAPILADQVVEVSVGPVGVGDTSCTFAYEIRNDGQVVATGETVSVLLDDDGRPRSLPEDWRRRLEPYRAVD